MHIASTLISAAVGGAFGTGSGGAVVASGAKFHKEKIRSRFLWARQARLYLRHR